MYKFEGRVFLIDLPCVFLALKIENVNWHPKLNKAAHHTSDYSSTEAILRRGQAFNITLNLQTTVQAWDNLSFIASTGPSPTESQQTKVVFNLSEESASGWSAVLEPSEPGCMNLAISSPANAVIGRYKLKLQIVSGNKVSSTLLGQFVLLFNPWCPNDDVFMANAKERQEYVLNDSGIIFQGLEKYIQQEAWNYGQFEEDILDISLAILDRSLNHRQDPALDVSNRNNPVYVSRVISAMVNSNDEKGVVEGKWNGKYRSGTNPLQWSGSVTILRKWYRGRYKPVRYGQCWVFAGVMCTVLRCLGIPTRVITNFNSAHDRNINLSIDKYIDISGKTLHFTEDSVWNFHVWNESWFIRRDLGSFYDGWQVLDATPQETSKGIYQCGPASTKAIKEGDVNLDYDSSFVFAAVNADYVTWIHYSNKRKERIYSDTRKIGKFISTKAVGSNSRVDVTANYKYPEGSLKERQVYKKALKLLGVRSTGKKAKMRRSRRRPSVAQRQNTTQPAQKPSISGKVILDASPVIGQDILLTFALRNLLSDFKTIKVKLRASAILYTRKPKAEILHLSRSIKLGSKEVKEIPFKISYSQYKNSLTDDRKILVTAVCETKQGASLLVEQDIVLQDPFLTIKVLGPTVVHKAVDVQVTFTNPLSEVVTDCVLRAEGSGLIKEQLRINVARMAPMESSTVQFEIIPYKSGTRQLQVDLVCIHFSDIKGFVMLDVAPVQ
ncbi:protein-glutamine gamma-glutamyltransferase 6-like [Falco biarmicus]|uniref:protein-glutamine gamma-glutamyltransferase 6-like n=1 Tax=Falco peregrinus TaxID=8954 RepID=UPI000FFB31F1|nr:protein-glutamine gamma-glutamyltransferase 6-like [Falco peregrinus]XP_027669295.1 protein-glutamine gamma-glutamyltransferase 6 [Falco cherrug]XP_037258623.1 protein-glutamine gamma-glutamyltransferase 6-like [Falco rusticolus]XP_056211109.1 protein-glutamine gamma-glutamyltransferase 6-like [Falco biarmicus]